MKKHLRQHRTIGVCGLRSKIFVQHDGIIFKQGVRRDLCGVALKRLLSVLLSVVMVTSMFGGMGFTVGATDTTKAIELVANGAAGGVLGA